ncbi:MAG: DUF2207 domain-containing protein [Pseudomonadota bacterium]
MMGSALRVLPALFLLLAPAAARADERILRYLSDVQVEKDGSLEVAEAIDVRAEHDQINHGIYRDFPTRYRGRNGSLVHVGFKFEGATLDGAPVSAATEPLGNGIRIKVGDPVRLVDVGEHSYVLHYRTTRQIGRFKDYDELYWNATGNGWAFPIDVAEARIRLPGPVTLGQRSVYTGPQGSTAQDAEVVDEKAGEILFRTTAPLGPYEGLTVAVAFPKDVIAGESSKIRLAEWLLDYGPPLVGLAGLIGLLAFYYVAWQRAGRNPRAGTVVPLFSPPDGLSPAGMRFLTKMGADNRGFAATLVDMGVRGHVRLVEEDGGWFSRKTRRIDRLDGGQELPPEEQAALDALCGPGGSIVMEQKNHAHFASARTALSETLQKGPEGRLFNRNLGWAFVGVALFLGALWLAAAAIEFTVGVPPTFVLVPLGAAASAALLFLFLQRAQAVGKCLASMAAFVLLAVAVVMGAPMVGDALSSGLWLPLLLPALALPLVVSSFWWIAAPTRAGRAVLDHIAGFKQYLSITEAERLDRMTPPERDTPQLFERYLPYAIALGVENRWAERFAGVLAAAAAQGSQGFGWYSGSSSPWDDPTGFADDVGSSLSSTISSAATAPGSSSGSGGGGSSGGGGGGGGGW